MIRVTLAKGFGGTIASFGGYVIATYETWECTIRIASLAIGCTVGLATLVSIGLDIKRKWNAK